MKAERLVLIEWLEKVKEAQPGEVVYVYCDDKHRQNAMAIGFREELTILSKINPKMAATIAIIPIFKDKMHWIALKKSGNDPETGFLKDADGNITRIKINAPARSADRRVLQAQMGDKEPKKDHQ